MTPYVAAENRDDIFVMPTWAAGDFFVNNERKAEFVCLERACAILRDAGRLEEHAIFVDVGAHIGTSTIPAITRHGFDRAIAIEPDADNLRTLRANVALNGLHKRVSVVAAGLSDTPGRLWFVPGSERGGWTKGQLTDKQTPNAEPVDAATLDSLTAAGVVDPTETGMLWMGQWFEESALLTAMTFLERRVPVVFVLRRDAITASSPLLLELRKSGYERVIDLRRPSLNEPLSNWAGALEPLENLATLSPRKSITDVLVF